MQNYYFCDMKKTFLLLLVSAITLAIPGYAFSQDDPGKKKGKLEPVYDIAFYYNLDNREISPSGQRFTDAMTINAAQLTPLFGIRVKQGPEITHKVMAGIDLVRNMGEIPTSAENANLNNTHLFQEILMYFSPVFQRPVTFSFFKGMLCRNLVKCSDIHFCCPYDAHRLFTGIENDAVLPGLRQAFVFGLIYVIC